MRVDVDEAGRDDEVAHIELAFRSLSDARGDAGDAVAGDRDVGLEAGAAGAVDHHAAAEDEVGVGVLRAQHVGCAENGGGRGGELVDEGATLHGQK